MFTSVRIKNLRSIQDSDRLPLSRVTIIVGANNSGKSTILRSIGVVQQGVELNDKDVRVGTDGAEIWLGFESLPLKDADGTVVGKRFGDGESRLGVSLSEGPASLFVGEQPSQRIRIERAPGEEPGNLVHPIFSARVLSSYQQQTNAKSARSVYPNDNNIVSRVRRLAGLNVPESAHFRTMCREILGVEFDVLDTEMGSVQHLGVAVNLDRYIPVESMGAGLSSTLNLLVTLSTAKDKIILVEEPENDLHPAALKRLLDEVAISAKFNQFIVTTHSSVVLTRLGAFKESTVLHVVRDDNVPPSASVRVANSSQERLEVLADLGYELPDLTLNQGWMIFEESSAERLIREFFAKWYAPGLLSLTFLGAKGDSRVRPLMNDYREMLLFSHLSNVYRGRAWVIVDAGPAGERIVSELRDTFKDWPKDRFQQWNELNFEAYYPHRFAGEVELALGEKDKQKKQTLKRELLEQVLDWISQDEELAREEFRESASEVVDKLVAIEREVKGLRLTRQDPGHA